jgi:hypothetical protein
MNETRETILSPGANVNAGDESVVQREVELAAGVAGFKVKSLETRGRHSFLSSLSTTELMQ